MSHELIAPLVERLGWTLIHSPWQFAAIALLLCIVLRLLKERSTEARYMSACIALFAMIVVAAFTFGVIDPVEGLSQTTMEGRTPFGETGISGARNERDSMFDKLTETQVPHSESESLERKDAPPSAGAGAHSDADSAVESLSGPFGRPFVGQVAGTMWLSATAGAQSAAGDHPAGDQPAQRVLFPDTVKQVEMPSDESGADISLALDKPEYFLGENVVLHWRIRNAGDQPLEFDFGGDGRTPGAKRAIRFKVEAFDAAGDPAPDPYPNPPNMGGLGGGVRLDPGEDFWDGLQLMRYREVTSRGKYTVKVYHDLGWEKRDPERVAKERVSSDIPPVPRKAPTVTTNIRFLMPNAEQARQVVDTMLAMPDHSGRSWGERGKPYADFELLRYPVYLPIATELAQRGDARGLDALGAMAFPEATAALLELMEHEDAAIAAKAGDLLLTRTPHIHDVPPSRRGYLVDRSWTDELKKSAMATAWKLLDEDDREGIVRGALLVHSLGTKDDLPALIRVMDRVLVAFKDSAVEQRAYLRRANASEAFAEASRELLRRGAQPPDSATTPGNAVVWLVALGANEDFRPDGWRETARGLVEHEIPFLRDVALRNLPLPLDAATVAVVAEAIKDDFAPVQGAACNLAYKARSEAFGPPLTDVLNSTENHWVMRAAFGAATECGVDNDRRLEICVRRMRPRDNDWNMLMLSLLKDGAIESHGHGSRAIDDWTSILPGIQNAWLEFIDSHRQELREGIRFKANDPAVTPKMFPPGFQLHGDGHASGDEANNTSDAEPIQEEGIERSSSAARGPTSSSPETKPQLAATIDNTGGGERPAFERETCAWHATHIVLADGGERIDGNFRVIESWKGDLAVGKPLSIPELVKYRDRVTREIFKWSVGRGDGERAVVSGRRMVMFLVRSGDGQEHEWFSAMMQGRHRHAIDFSVVWIEGERAYAVQQPRNPGPNAMVALDGGLAKLKTEMILFCDVQSRLHSAGRIKDLMQRAAALREFAISESWHAGREAFAALADCGRAALPVLRDIINDDRLANHHGAAITSMGKASGKDATPFLIELIQDETTFWNETAPKLPVGWWNDWRSLDRSSKMLRIRCFRGATWN